MAIVTENPRAWGFLLSEAMGNRSRENGTLKSGQKLKAGTVLTLSGGKLVGYGPAAAPTYGDPTTGGDNVLVGLTTSKGEFVHAVAGVLGANVDATGGDVPVAYLARDAEVNVHELIYAPEQGLGGEKAATLLGLADLGIIAR